MEGSYPDRYSLHAHKVIAGYRNFKIRGVSFSLDPGDIMGLVGRSGSGKSTILSTLTGAIRPQGGRFELLRGPKRQPLIGNIGYSPQRNALFSDLTVMENLMTFARLQGISRKVAKERAGILLSELSLAKHKRKMVSDLSGGMEKRVDIAVALIQDPAVVILDEPFNGLDVALQRFIWDVLLHLSERGKIIIVTSHLMDDIQHYCNKIGLVESNRFFKPEDVKALLASHDGSLRTLIEDIFKRKSSEVIKRG
jgi:ABC-2 type transport system ATP-binding protein